MSKHIVLARTRAISPILVCAFFRATCHEGGALFPRFVRRNARRPPEPFVFPSTRSTASARCHSFLTTIFHGLRSHQQREYQRDRNVPSTSNLFPKIAFHRSQPAPDRPPGIRARRGQARRRRRMPAMAQSPQGHLPARSWAHTAHFSSKPSSSPHDIGRIDKRPPRSRKDRLCQSFRRKGSPSRPNRVALRLAMPSAPGDVDTNPSASARSDRKARAGSRAVPRSARAAVRRS